MLRGPAAMRRFFCNERSDVKDTDAKRVESHLRRTFGNNAIGLKPRPK